MKFPAWPFYTDFLLMFVHTVRTYVYIPSTQNNDSKSQFFTLSKFKVEGCTYVRSVPSAFILTTQNTHNFLARLKDYYYIYRCRYVACYNRSLFKNGHSLCVITGMIGSIYRLCIARTFINLCFISMF